jgi:hypothetical protein
VAPALDVGLAVGALAVADGNVGDFQVQFRGADQKVNVT